MDLSTASIAASLGLSSALLLIILVWSLVWKGIALWKPQKLKISDGYQKSDDF